MALDIHDPIYNDEEAARAYLEAQRWPNGPFCPHCGEAERVTKLQGKSHRPGLYSCPACRKNFTVTVGTLYERSHVKLHKWVLATHLMAASKKGVSAHQLHRMLGVTYKTAWFMAHRIREGMRDGSSGPLGGNNAVEADETFIGRKKGVPVPKGGYSHKHAVLGLVERGGKVRTVHISEVTKEEIGALVRDNVAREAWLMTDEAKHYRTVGKEFLGHSTVHHALGEYVDPDDAMIHTNTIEGYFSLFKRGMKGIYQHCGEQHLHRYLTEFEFRYNTRIKLGYDDYDRAALAVRGIEGKRLTYRQPRSAAHA